GPAFRRPIDHHYRHWKASPQKAEGSGGYHRHGSLRHHDDEKEHAGSGDPKPAENKLQLPTSRAPVSIRRRFPFQEQPMRRDSPIAYANNGIECHARVIRQKNDGEHGAQAAVARFAPKSSSGRRWM